jgi:TolB-like protein/Tfp pilus assembly protein PilF
MSFFEELKRRNVFRLGTAYVISAWVLLQFVDLVLENIQAPDWVMKVFMLALAVGFPLAIFFAWAFEMTPEGIKKEKDVDRSQSITHQTGRKLDRTIIVVLLIAVVYFAWDNFSPAPSGQHTDSRAGQPQTRAEQATKSIAVLPFADLSQSGDQEWFADGLAEEILNALAKTPDLLVSSRTSSFRYKGTTLDISEIAADLGVAHILEGSVRSSGNRIRVTAQLIRASDGFHLWSENYDRDVADMIEIQEDLAQNIARALETTMDPAALAEMTRVGTRSVAAYQAYIRGVAAYLESYAGTSTKAGETLIKGYEHFEDARGIDPQFAKAHLNAALFWKFQLSPIRLDSGLTDIPPLEMLSRFNQRIDRAIATAPTTLDKKSYEAQKALVELRLRDAIRLFREYVDERPNDQQAWLALNDVAGLASENELRQQVLAHWRERSDSDTLSAISFIADGYRAGLTAEGADVGLKSVQRWPGNNNILYQSHRALMWAGRYAEGKTLAEQYQRVNTEESVMVQARQACAEGRRDEVELLLENNDPNDNYATSNRWHLLKLLGMEKQSAEVLRPYADSGVPFMLASWLTYTKFDPTPFPALVAVLEREGVKRPARTEIPFQCPPPEQTSIAVLPFINMSNDAENEFFSDGISEEILNVLASIPDLKVAARTSAFAFKKSSLKISEIAEELGVNHVLEGSVRKSGNQVRVTAQLIKAEDGFHLWSANYDRELTNIFAIQDEIATSIADALKVSLELESSAAGNLTGTSSLEAYEHYLMGMSLWHLRTADSLNRALEEFNQAISLDPKFAKAYAGLALTLSVMDGYVIVDFKSMLEKATAAAETALQLDSHNVEALTALGQVMSSQFKYPEATELFQKAIKLNPSFATAHQWYGNMLGFTGDTDAGIATLKKAWNLDPRSRIIGSNLSSMLNLAGRREEALEVLNQVIEFAPDFPDALSFLVNMQIESGQCDSIEENTNRLVEMLNKTVNSTQVYLDLCQAGDPAARQEAIIQIQGWHPYDFPAPDNPTLSYAAELLSTLVALGAFDAAIDMMDKDTGPGNIYFFEQIRARNSEVFRDFYCDPRVRERFEQRGIPYLDNGGVCQ